MKQPQINNNPLSELKKTLSYIKLLTIICLLSLALLPLYLHLTAGEQSNNELTAEQASQILTSVPDNFEIAPFDDSPEGKMAALGHRLITETYALIGPNTEKAVTGNKLACSSCHLNGGTKAFAAPYIGLSGLFPIYIGREDKVESLEERINGCLERSMNGRSIDVNSTEMRAMMAYIKHLSKDVVVGKRIKGQGFVDFNIPDRAADLKNGGLIYKNSCASCHATDGQGLAGTAGNKEGGYLYPPLWGADTYNDGAGMARLLTAAKFIKGNMPLGVTHDSPLLSDEEAYDVAAYINSHSRPIKANKELDYPDLSKKPKDSPYPPYADEISQEQHKIGPFNF